MEQMRMYTSMYEKILCARASGALYPEEETI